MLKAIYSAFDTVDHLCLMSVFRQRFNIEGLASGWFTYTSQVAHKHSVHADIRPSRFVREGPYGSPIDKVLGLYNSLYYRTSRDY